MAKAIKHKSFAIFTAAYDAIHTPICILSEVGLIVYANQEAAALIGRDADALMNTSLGTALRCVHSIDHRCGDTSCSDCPLSPMSLSSHTPTGTDPWQKTTLMVSVDDTGRTVHISFSANRIGVDGKVYVVVAFRAISDESPRTSEFLAPRIAEETPLSIIVTDSAGVITYVSPYAEEVSGYSAEELIGETPLLLRDVDHTTVDNSKLWKTISSGQVWRGIFHNRTKNGEPFREKAIIVPIADVGESGARYVAIKQDSAGDSIDGSIGIIDAGRSFQFLDSSGRAIFGVNLDDLKRRSITDFVEPEDIERIFGTTPGRSQRFYRWHEARITTPNGERRVISIAASPYRDVDRRKAGHAIVFHDITLQHELEHERRFQVEFYNTAIEIASALSSATDQEISRQIDFALRTLGEFLGGDRCYLCLFQEEERVGSRIREWCAPEVPPHAERLPEVLSGIDPSWKTRILQGEIVQIDPQPDTAATLLLPITTEKHEVSGFLGLDALPVGRRSDSIVTQRLQVVVQLIGSALSRARSQAEIAAREERLRAVFSNIEDVVWSLSYPGYRSIFLSPSIEGLLGISVEELSEEPLLVLQYIYSQDVQSVRSAYEKIGESGHATLEFRIIDANGDLRWMLNRAHLLYNEDGVAHRVDGVLTDITSRKRSEDEARASAAKLRLKIRQQQIIDLIMDGITGQKSETDFLRDIAAEIPAGFLDSDAAHTTITLTLSGIEYSFSDLPEVLPSATSVAPIVVDEAVIGSAEARRIITGSHADADDSVFRKEETEFLEVVAERIGAVISGARLRRQLSTQAVAMDNASVGIFIAEKVDEDFLIVYVNRDFEALTGYTRAVIGGRSPSVLFANDPGDMDSNVLLSELSPADPIDALLRVRTKDGRILWCESRLALVIEEGTGKQQTIGVLSDVTDNLAMRRELLQSEQRLRLGQEYANIGTWDWNIKTGELFWSDPVAPLFGYPKGETESSYENFLAAIHPDDRPLVESAIQHSLQSKTRYTVEHRVVWPGGTERWLMGGGSATYDKEGNPDRMIGLVQDITDRKVAELELRDARERLRLAIEGAGDGLWYWNLVSKEMVFSDLFVKMLAYEPGELPNLESTWTDSIHPDDLPWFESALAEYLEGTRDTFIVELRLRCKDGMYKWILCRGSLTERDREGNPVRMVGIQSDISARKSNETQILRQQEFQVILSEHAASFVSISADAFDAKLIQFFYELAIHWNADRVVMTRCDHERERFDLSHQWNRRNLDPIAEDVAETADESRVANATALLDVKEPILITSSDPIAAFSQRWHKKPLFGCAIALVIPMFRNQQLEGFLTFGAIEERLEWAQIPVEGVGIVGQIVTAALTKIESDRHLVEMKRVSDDARAAAEKANRAKSEFLSSMSHELRTPLNAVLGFGQILQGDEELRDDQRDSAREIIEAGSHLLQLVDELLDLSSIENRYVELSLEPVDCDLIIADSVSMNRDFAQEHGISVSIERSPGVRVIANQLRLRQVLVSLLSNAVKYNRPGGSVSMSTSDDGTSISIHVVDTGEGIPAERLSELFTTFNRLGRERGDIQGTGIGLSLSKRLVGLMHGEMGVESEVGIGSHFYIRLPRGT